MPKECAVNNRHSKQVSERESRHKTFCGAHLKGGVRSVAFSYCKNIYSVFYKTILKKNH